MDPQHQPPIRVVFVLLPGSLVLDWAGPAEALRIANQRLQASGHPERFAIEFASPRPTSIASVGVALAGLSPLPTQWSGPAWVVLVGLPGDTIAIDNPETQDLLHWLRGQRFERGRVELVTVCAGAVLAAHAGVLAGRRATTHHHHLDELRAIEPRCDVVSNRVFVIDPPLYSSAGVTTGIDLVLHRIAEICGEALAAQVAQTMVVALRRGPHDPELSPFLAYRNHLHAALHRVQDAVSEQPQADWSVPRMAQSPTPRRGTSRGSSWSMRAWRRWLICGGCGSRRRNWRCRRARASRGRRSCRASAPTRSCAGRGTSSDCPVRRRKRTRR
jgi:transcriptional regulator GlxA family with amidase domain